MTQILLFVAIILIIVLLRWVRGQSDESPPEIDFYAYKDARAAYLQAQQNFDEANSQYIDVAISDLRCAEIQVNSELWKIRNETIGSNPDTWEWITLACDGDLRHHNRMMATLEIAVEDYEKW